MALVSLKTATAAQLKEINNVGDVRAEILLDLRKARKQLTYAMIEALTNKPMATEEKARFIEWTKDEDSESDDNGHGARPSGRPRGLSFDGSSSWKVFRKKFVFFLLSPQP